MILVQGNSNKPAVAVNIDKDDDVLFAVIYKPDTWEANKEYLKDEVVIPLSASGFYQKVSSPGVSGQTEPVFGTAHKKKTNDNTIEWTAINYNLYVNSNETLTESSWEVTNNVLLSNMTIIGGVAFVLIKEIPLGVRKFTLKNSVSKQNGTIVEKKDTSFIFTVVER